MFRLRWICLALGFCMTVGGVAEEGGSKPAMVTHADAALIFARHSGQFEKYVKPDATLSDCVAFLNETGVYFSLKDILSKREFTQKDCARVMGQISIIFSGNAEFDFGKVHLPREADSWEDYCLLYDVKYREVYQTMLETVAKFRGH